MIESDLGYASKVSPSLQEWVDQGVLLCNASPTLHTYNNRNKLVSSLATTVWTRFTTQMLKNLAAYSEDVIFVLFGKAAHAMEDHIKETNVNAIIIRAPHPSRRNKTAEPYPVFRTIEEIHITLKVKTIVW